MSEAPLLCGSEGVVVVGLAGSLADGGQGGGHVVAGKGLCKGREHDRR